MHRLIDKCTNLCSFWNHKKQLLHKHKKHTQQNITIITVQKLKNIALSVQYQTHTTEINKTLKIDLNYAKAYAYIMKLSMFVWSVKIQRIVLRETKPLKSIDKHNEITTNERF